MTAKLAISIRFTIPLVLAAVGLDARGNVVGSDAQNFNPTTNGIDFVTVQSSETLAPGVFNLGLFLNYAVNSLPVQEQDSGDFKVTDTLLMVDLNAGVGLTKNWDLGLSYPRLLRQAIDTKDTRGQFSQTGNTEIRVNSKYRLLQRHHWGLALVLSTNINRIENNPYVGQDAGPTINTELAISGNAADYSWAVNLGYRSKQSGKAVEGTFIKPTRDQIIASVAISRLIKGIDTKMIAEVFGARSTKTGANKTLNRQASAVESMVGLKTDLTTNLAFHLGGGTELMEGVSSPDWRMYSGINWAFGPVWGQNNNRVRLIRPGPRQPLNGDQQHMDSTDIVLDSDIPDADDDLDLSRSERIPILSGEVVLVSNTINFAFDSASKMSPGAQEAIRGLARYLRRPPEFSKLTIEGHTDSVGRAEYNMTLSLRRASAIKAILVEQLGMDPNKIVVKGYGETRPIADNGNYQGREKNRRVEFKVERPGH